MVQAVLRLQELGVKEIKIKLEYRQTCFPDPDMESGLYDSAKISFECYYRECKKLRDNGAAKLDLEPVIKEMLAQGITHKSGDIMCFLGDDSCKNKLFYDITIDEFCF